MLWQVTSVDPYSFGKDILSLNLSHNVITFVSPINFDNYSFVLQSLYISHNRLSVLSIELLSTIPGLNVLAANNNSIFAIPVISNHLAVPASMAGNQLTCTSYGPFATGCTCKDGDLDVHCGYVRCTTANHGCERDAEFNSSDCSGAPWSSCVCVDDVPNGQYYDSSTEAFRQLTVCESEFMDTTRTPPRPLDAYEFSAPTRTTNRQCSICSICPQG